ncbi:toprim domain-containing protein [Mycobacterium simiae]|uniref:toprim domain-containing protein n=1 Tax=Mycobacterium simiae TaxID=1784 RepID=UPI00165F2CB3|nr:toprim domain-containing protein [Mycobacterium simiae]
MRVYTYTTADGRAVQQVIRHECACTGRPHKRFQQRYRHGRRWVYRKPDGFTPELYRPAALRAAAAGLAWLFLTEGEKDADTLTALGRPATTNAQGAHTFPASLVARFAGHRVAVLADRDLAGYRRALQLHQLLAGTAARVVILLAALERDKADVTDHVEAGLWRPDEPFGGLREVSVADAHALALLAAAGQAADRSDVAVAEAAAHRDRHGGAGSRAAARWAAEAAAQRRVVHRAQRDLHRHTAGNRSPAAAAAAQQMAALRARVDDDHHRRARPAAPGASDLKALA